jgi:hypothetical protein
LTQISAIDEIFASILPQSGGRFLSTLREYSRATGVISPPIMDERDRLDSEDPTYFAVVPDGTTEPAALFRELQDAISWGLSRWGADHFAIRGFVPGLSESANENEPELPSALGLAN